MVEDGFGPLKKGGGYRMANGGQKMRQTSYSRSFKVLQLIVIGQQARYRFT